MTIEQTQHRAVDAFAETERRLSQIGTVFFSTQQAAECLDLNADETRRLLAEMESESLALRVCRDGWVLTWEYRPDEQREAPVPTAYLDDMMRHLGVEYDLSYAAAARMRGASHHGVMCHRVHVEADSEADMDALELRHADGPADLAVVFHRIDPQRNRTVATMRTSCSPPSHSKILAPEQPIVRVATMETILLDMMEHPERCGGMDHIATIVVKMLFWNLLHPELLAEASDRYAVAVAQRTGSLLQRLRGIQHRINLRPLMRHVRSRGMRHSVNMRTGEIDRSLKADRWGVTCAEPLDPDL